jgi:hypothetical protein
MAKLAQLQVRRLQQFNVADDVACLRWHKQGLNHLIRRFGLSTYQLLWLSFAKGVVLGGVLVGCAVVPLR